MKKIVVLFLSFVLITMSLVGCGSKKVETNKDAGKKEGTQKEEAKKIELNAIFMKQAGYSEEDITKMTQAYESDNPNVKVNLTFVAYESLEQKILTAATTGGYDVALIDAPWTAKFAKAGMIKEVTDQLPDESRKDIFKGALDSVSYAGKLYGMPWLNDTKYLFYNEKMLKEAGFNEAPKTWEELIEQAKVIKEKGIVKYPIVWSWAQAEALMCDFTSLTHAFGGAMVDENGHPQLTDENNKKALEMMVESLTSGLSNPSSTEFLEEDVRGTFSSGNAAFALNWTYMYNLAKDPEQSKVVEDVRIAVSPGTASVKSASVNGGMGLAITSGCKNVNEAWDYITYLSSKDVQKTYAKNALPIWKSLYDVQEVIDTNPDVVNVSKVQYDYLVNRPQVAWYGELSTDMQVIIQQALLGNISVDQAAEEAQKRAVEIAEKN